MTIPVEEVTTRHKLGVTSTERRVLKRDLGPLLAKERPLNTRCSTAPSLSHCFISCCFYAGFVACVLPPPPPLLLLLLACQAFPAAVHLQSRQLASASEIGVAPAALMR